MNRTEFVERVKGGKGSGFFQEDGHRGRPGEVGGSKPAAADWVGPEQASDQALAEEIGVIDEDEISPGLDKRFVWLGGENLFYHSATEDQLHTPLYAALLLQKKWSDLSKDERKTARDVLETHWPEHTQLEEIGKKVLDAASVEFNKEDGIFIVEAGEQADRVEINKWLKRIKRAFRDGKISGIDTILLDGGGRNARIYTYELDMITALRTGADSWSWGKIEKELKNQIKSTLVKSLKGGEGSGFTSEAGHLGRPGEVGGSRSAGTGPIGREQAKDEDLARKVKVESVYKINPEMGPRFVWLGDSNSFVHSSVVPTDPSQSWLGFHTPLYAALLLQRKWADLSKKDKIMLRKSLADGAEESTEVKELGKHLLDAATIDFNMNGPALRLEMGENATRADMNLWFKRLKRAIRDERIVGIKVIYLAGANRWMHFNVGDLDTISAIREGSNAWMWEAVEKEFKDGLQKTILAALKGGKGSGFWAKSGHAGIPGHRGGSQPGGVASSGNFDVRSATGEEFVKYFAGGPSDQSYENSDEGRAVRQRIRQTMRTYLHDHPDVAMLPYDEWKEISNRIFASFGERGNELSPAMETNLRIFSILHEEQEFLVKRAICRGEITPEEGAEISSAARSGGEPWKEMSPGLDLYHATSSAAAVVQSGIQSRFERGTSSATGLGGGDDKTVSFTGKASYAREIERSLHEMWLVANGKLTVRKMVELAQSGAGGVGRPWDAKLLDYSKSLVGDRSLEEIIDIDEGRGIKRGIFGMVEDRPYNQQEIEWNRVSLFKSYMAARATEGGFENTMFMFNDIQAFAKLDPKEFKVLRYRPRRKGLRGQYFWAEDEYRITGADILKHKETIDYFDPDDLDTIYGVLGAKQQKVLKGGEGSGNWGHAGRPGIRGGSKPKKDASLGVIIAGKLSEKLAKKFLDAAPQALADADPGKWGQFKFSVQNYPEMAAKMRLMEHDFREKLLQGRDSIDYPIATARDASNWFKLNSEYINYTKFLSGVTDQQVIETAQACQDVLRKVKPWLDDQSDKMVCYSLTICPEGSDKDFAALGSPRDGLLSIMVSPVIDVEADSKRLFAQAKDMADLYRAAGYESRADEIMAVAKGYGEKRPETHSMYQIKPSGESSIRHELGHAFSYLIYHDPKSLDSIDYIERMIGWANKSYWVTDRAKDNQQECFAENFALWSAGITQKINPEVLAEFDRLFNPRKKKGGEGSGNWGHAGRPGKVGGSLPARAGAVTRSGISYVGSLPGEEKSSYQKRLEFYQVKYEKSGLPAGVDPLHAPIGTPASALRWFALNRTYFPGITIRNGVKGHQLVEIAQACQDVLGKTKVGLDRMKKEKPYLFDGQLIGIVDELIIGPEQERINSFTRPTANDERRIIQLSTPSNTMQFALGTASYFMERAQVSEKIGEQEYAKELRKIANNYANRRADTHSMFQIKPVASAFVRHEFGHAFQALLYLSQAGHYNQWEFSWDYENKKGRVDARSDFYITKRAEDNGSECFAENFALWSAGITHKMNPYMVDLFNKTFNPTTKKGGKGSGYFGHAGIPGHQGGSQPGDTLRMPITDGSSARIWFNANRKYFPNVMIEDSVSEKSLVDTALACQDVVIQVLPGWERLKRERPYLFAGKESVEIVDDLLIRGEYANLNNSEVDPREMMVGKDHLIKTVTVSPPDKTSREYAEFYLWQIRDMVKTFQALNMPGPAKELEDVAATYQAMSPSAHSMMSISPPASSLIRHELGHIFHFMFYAERGGIDLGRYVRDLGERDYRKLATTQRGKDDVGECFAENFALWSAGKKEIVDSKMASLFEWLFRK